MKLFEGKTTTERNKIIAAAGLGLVALVALYLAFGRGAGSTTATTVKVTTPPKASVPSGTNADKFRPPTAEEEALAIVIPVVYQPGNSYAPDAGRNIFAFYEPPPPCLDCPVPPPKSVELKPPPPPIPPPLLVSFVTPQSVYAGSKGFRLEVNGEKFTPESRIYFNQNELPTTFINSQKLIADIPAEVITQEGPRQIIVQTPDGKLYSNQFILTVEAPPKPGFQYIGMIGRKRYNNDTAYFLESDKKPPFGARLNDVLAGRFRLVDISPAEVVFEDVNLGFRHRLAISKAVAPAGGGGAAPTRGQPNDGGFVPFDPSTMQKGGIPGIPQNPGGAPSSAPPMMMQPQPGMPRKMVDEKKDDVDDND